MTDEKREELKARYNIDRLPLECGQGWYPLIEQFLEEAKAADELERLEIHQIKEKFGELRIYHNGSRYLQGVSRKLCRVSLETCEVCGEPGRRRLDEGVEQTRCDRCAAEGNRKSFRVEDMDGLEAEALKRGLNKNKYGE